MTPYQLKRKLHAVISGKMLHERALMPARRKTLVQVMISTAKAGTGPGNADYPAYEPSYVKALGLQTYTGGEQWSRRATTRALGKMRGKTRFNRATAAGLKAWLYGLEQGHHMLDPRRFSWSYHDGKAWLVWTGADEQMSIYGRVHQEGLPMGKGKDKKRTWMHFANDENRQALNTIYRQAAEELVAEWNAGTLNA